MNNATPLIIEAAINGATSKEKNRHVPRTVDEIAESAFACLEAGASIVHNHNDEPNVGGSGCLASEPYTAAWSRILERYPDALLYPTYAGGGPHTNVRERYAHIDELRLAGLLRMPLLDPGTANKDGLNPDGARDRRPCVPDHLRRRSLDDGLLPGAPPGAERLHLRARVAPARTRLPCTRRVAAGNPDQAILRRRQPALWPAADPPRSRSLPVIC